MDALEKLGWLKSPSHDGYIYFNHDRSISIHQYNLTIWDDWGDACKFSLEEVIALAEVIKTLKEASK